MSEAVAEIGSTVWTADASSTAQTRPCRVCAGDRKVILIMGSGERVELDCGMCQAGYESPTGVETFYAYEAKPSPFRVTTIESVESGDGRCITYRNGGDGFYTSVPANKCYLTREAALAACAELVAEREREIEQRLSQKEKSTNKSYAWNAGYHLREAKKFQKEAEYHEKKAVVLKAKSLHHGPEAGA